MAATKVYARLDLDPVREALEQNAKLMFGPSDHDDKSTVGTA
jgi:hypothetical protein